MQILRYQGRDLRDALERARRAHGDEALVLSHETAPDGGVTVAIASGPRRRTPIKPAAPASAPEPGLADVEERLRRNGASGALVRGVTQRIREADARGMYALDAAAEHLERAFRVAPSPKPGTAPLAFAFTGPAGAGKTLALAKLARHLQRAGRVVTAATLDASRAGFSGLRQLLADFEPPPRVAVDGNELLEVVRRRPRGALTLIDTAGHPGRGYAALRELARAGGDVHTWVVASAAGDPQEVVHWLEAYRGPAPRAGADHPDRPRRTAGRDARDPGAALARVQLLRPRQRSSPRPRSRSARALRRPVPARPPVERAGAHTQASAAHGRGESLKGELEPQALPPPRDSVLAAPFLWVTGGKGGVGKTTLTVNLGVELARRGYRVLLVDFDLGLGNLDVFLRLHPTQTLEDAHRGRCRTERCIVRAPHGLDVLPASSGSPQMAAADPVRRTWMFDEIARIGAAYDIVLGDSAAGIGPEVLASAALAGRVWVVTTPDPAALTDAYGLIKALDSWVGARAGDVATPELVINQASDLEEAERVARRLRRVCERFLARTPRLAGWLPRARGVAEGARTQRPFALGRPEALEIGCLRRLARSLEPWLPAPARPVAGSVSDAG